MKVGIRCLSIIRWGTLFPARIKRSSFGRNGRDYHRKDASGVRIADHTMIPLVTHYEKGYDHYTAYLLSDYTDELGAKQVVKTNDGNPITVKVMQDLFDNIVNGAGNE